MTIRAAQQDEVATLQNLNDEVFIDNAKYDADLKLDWAQSEEGKTYFAEIVNNPKSICLIAEEDTKPVGYLVAKPKHFGYRLSSCIEIENMGVSPHFRSKGIGEKLIYECIRIAQERGFGKVYVNAYIQNTKAIHFYEKCGFTKIDISLEKNIQP